MKGLPEINAQGYVAFSSATLNLFFYKIKYIFVSDEED